MFQYTSMKILIGILKFEKLFRNAKYLIGKFGNKQD